MGCGVNVTILNSDIDKAEPHQYHISSEGISPWNPDFCKTEKIIFTQNCEKSKNRRKRNLNSNEKISVAASFSSATNLQNNLLHYLVFNRERTLFLPRYDFVECSWSGIFLGVLSAEQLPHFPSILVYLPRDKLPFLIFLQSGDFFGIMRLHKFPPFLSPAVNGVLHKLLFFGV